MRICPICSVPLKEYDYYFCSSCLNELPQDFIKISKPHILNVKLKKELIPNQKFLIFNIPYEHRFSARFVTNLIWVTLLILIALFIKYNFDYGYNLATEFYSRFF